MKVAAALFLVVGLIPARPTLAATQAGYDQMVEELSSQDAEVRKRALGQLARAGHPQAAGAVAALVSDGDAGVQLTALDTLLTLLSSGAAHSSVTAVPDIAGVPSAPRRAFERGDRVARPVPMGAFPHLAAALAGREVRVREDAAYVFAILATSEHGLVPAAAISAAQDAFVSMLDAPDPGLRLAGSRAAGRIFRASLAGPPPNPSLLVSPLAERLIDAMNRPDLVEQSAAMEALGRARESRAADALLERLAFHRVNGPPQLAMAALNAVARLAPAAGAEAVRTLLTDPWTQSDQARLALLFARQRLLADGSVVALKNALADPKLGDRAREYLSELGPIP